MHVFQMGSVEWKWTRIRETIMLEERAQTQHGPAQLVRTFVSPVRLVILYNYVSIVAYRAY